MMRSLFAAISGLRVHQQMLDVTANNIANVNTVGYKTESVSFSDALSELQQGASGPSAGGLGGTNARQIGLGVEMGAIDNVMSAGATQSTGNPFDLAIQGPGWFVVSDKLDTTTTPPSLGGNFYYTRAGNFTRDAQGHLVTSDGNYVAGIPAGGDVTLATGRVPITIPAGAQSVSIGPSGVVTVVDSTGATTTTTVQLATFPNEAGLERVGGNRFKETANSDIAGDATYGVKLNAPGGGTGAFGTLAVGAVEMSNVDLAQEFTDMITAQRGFQANGRVISATDQVLQELVNLKQ